MDFFLTYFELGFQHIMDWMALDHLLFILSFTCIFTFSKIRETILLATAFTIGHTITLALATLKIIEANMAWVEFIIPLTIFLSAIYNFSFNPKKRSKKDFNGFKYTIIGLFGLIHGLGFSNYLQSLLGKESTLFIPLLSFNIGLEIAQILVIFLILLANSLLINTGKVNHKSLVLIISGIILGIVAPMLVERFPLP